MILSILFRSNWLNKNPKDNKDLPEPGLPLINVILLCIKLSATNC